MRGFEPPTSPSRTAYSGLLSYIQLLLLLAPKLAAPTGTLLNRSLLHCLRFNFLALRHVIASTHLGAEDLMNQCEEIRTLDPLSPRQVR